MVCNGQPATHWVLLWFERSKVGFFGVFFPSLFFSGEKHFLLFPVGWPLVHLVITSDGLPCGLPLPWPPSVEVQPHFVNLFVQ